MISNDPSDFALGEIEEYEDEDEDDEVLVSYSIAMPFEQHRIITPIAEMLAPINQSPQEGVRVQVAGGKFLRVNADLTALVEVEMGPIVGVIVAEQRGQVMIFDSFSQCYIGWLRPEDYHAVVPFNPEGSRWIQ